MAETKGDSVGGNRGEAGRLANGRFPKGVSGNPKGRPVTLAELKLKIQRRGSWLTDQLFRIVEDRPQIRRGEDGAVETGPAHRDRIKAIELLKAYGYGKPVQAVEVSGPGGTPIQSTDVPLESLTTGELRRRLAGLKKKDKPSGE